MCPSHTNAGHPRSPLFDPLTLRPHVTSGAMATSMDLFRTLAGLSDLAAGGLMSQQGGGSGAGGRGNASESAASESASSSESAEPDESAALPQQQQSGFAAGRCAIAFGGAEVFKVGRRWRTRVHAQGRLFQMIVLTLRS